MDRWTTASNSQTAPTFRVQGLGLTIEGLRFRGEGLGETFRFGAKGNLQLSGFRGQLTSAVAHEHQAPPLAAARLTCPLHAPGLKNRLREDAMS